MTRLSPAVLSILGAGLTLTACFGGHDVDCAVTPNDPVCPRIDANLPDGGTDANLDAPDAHVPCAGACSGSTPQCDTASDMCVACLTNEHCTESSAAHCEAAHSCGDCTLDADCERFTATPVCDETSGHCVACTSDTEATRCGANSCRTSDGTCTTTPRATLNTCARCEADSECVAGRHCVHHVFMGTDTGSYCFLDAAGGCGDSVAANRPFRTPAMLTSVDGVSGMYCMPPPNTTCRGIDDFQSTSCSTSDECGAASLDDGFCPTDAPGAGLCNYVCTGAVDCRMGTTCQGTPSRCAP